MGHIPQHNFFECAPHLAKTQLFQYSLSLYLPLTTKLDQTLTGYYSRQYYDINFMLTNVLWSKLSIVHELAIAIATYNSLDIQLHKFEKTKRQLANYVWDQFVLSGMLLRIKKSMVLLYVRILPCYFSLLFFEKKLQHVNHQRIAQWVNRCDPPGGIGEQLVN